MIEDESEVLEQRKWSERHLRAAGIKKVTLSVPTPPFQEGDQLESPISCHDKYFMNKPSDKELVDIRGPDGYTPLMLASSISRKRSLGVSGSKSSDCSDDGVATISDLISQGATVNATTDTTGRRVSLTFSYICPKFK